MIPVLAIPVINHPELLAETVASIDHPTGTLLIIDNSPTLGMGDVAEDAMPDCVERLVVTEPPTNLGVAASWNLAIRSYPDAPWWCLVNADIRFAPGDLGRLVEAMAEHPIATLVDFGAFGLDRECVERVGLFDEQFVPIYCEDADYEYRCQLAGVAIHRLAAETTHVGSVSYRHGPHARDNARSYPENRAYYEAKWGGPLRGGERFTTPFDRGGDIRDWRLEVSRLRRLAWPART